MIKAPQVQLCGSLQATRWREVLAVGSSLWGASLLHSATTFRLAASKRANDIADNCAIQSSSARASEQPGHPLTWTSKVASDLRH